VYSGLLLGENGQDEVCARGTRFYFTKSALGDAAERQEASVFSAPPARPRRKKRPAPRVKQAGGERASGKLCNLPEELRAQMQILLALHFIFMCERPRSAPLKTCNKCRRLLAKVFNFHPAG